jgi:glycosyltransferase involved in cell wall biosynthesis
MTKRLRVLWVSDAPWAKSGYGVQTDLIAPHLAQHCDLALATTYGLHGDSMVRNGIKVYPGGADPFANDVIQQRAKDWRADMVITLKDLPVFRPEAFRGLRWYPLVPIDHEPITPHIAHLARQCTTPIAYAPNGIRALRSIGLDPLYAPHVFDREKLYRENRAAMRRAIGVPEEAFLVLTVAVNRGGIPSRKAWPELVEGFKQFAAHEPRALWFCHTNEGSNGFEGAVPLRPLLGSFADRVAFPDPDAYQTGFGDDYLRALYSAADVLLAPSLGEGFGVPVLEAQACGCPVIVGDWAATADLCWGGVKIPRQHATPFLSTQQSYQMIPHPAAIAEALRVVASWSPEQWREHSDMATNEAMHYEVRRVTTEHWVPLLATVQRRIEAEKQGRGVTRIIKAAEVLG